MRRSKAVAALFFLAAAAANHALAVIDRIVEKQFSIPSKGAASIDVDTFYGAIKLSTTSDPLIHVLVCETIEAESDAQADRQLRDLDLQISETAAPAVADVPAGAPAHKLPGVSPIAVAPAAKSAAKVHVVVHAAFRRTVHWSWEKWPPLGLSFEIQIPERCDVRLVSHEGAINIPPVRGDVEVRAQNGEVFLGAVNGSVTVKSGMGNVSVASCTGPLTIDARAGNVLVGRLGGLGRIDGVGGTIEVQASHGPLVVRGDGSDVHVGFVYPIRGDADVRASGGDVEATFETTVRAHLDAHASTFGQVRIRDLELAASSGKPGDSHIIGTLGGGGPLLLLRASGGNVRLRGVPAVRE